MAANSREGKEIASKEGACYGESGGLADQALSLLEISLHSRPLAAIGILSLGDAICRAPLGG